MSRILYPHRWFVWAIVVSVVTGVVLLWAITLYAIDIQYGTDNYNAQFLDTFNRIRKKQNSNNIDTSSWLTYRNEKYGFEFKYPLKFKAPLVKNEKIIVFDNIGSDFVEDDLEISINDRANKNLDQLIEEEGSDQNNRYSEIMPFYLDGIEARKFNARYHGGATSVVVYVNRNKYLYRISYGVTIDDSFHAVDEFNEALSTFKFFEPGSASSALKDKACVVGSEKLVSEPLGSHSWRVIGAESNKCIIEFTKEIEGGYTVYECRLPVNTDDIETQVSRINIAEMCKKVRSGNVFLDQS